MTTINPRGIYRNGAVKYQRIMTKRQSAARNESGGAAYESCAKAASEK